MAISIEGIDKLFKKFDNIDNEIYKELEKTMYKSLLPVQAQAKALTPVDTGTLKRSINTKVTTGERKVSGSVGTYIDYAIYLELGTRKMLPRPFLRPSFHAMKGDVEKVFKAEIKKVLRKVASK